MNWIDEELSLMMPRSVVKAEDDEFLTMSVMMNTLLLAYLYSALDVVMDDGSTLMLLLLTLK